MTSDYYSILGVSPAAQDVVIRAAYRALIRHYHPDTNRDPEAQERVREINAAFAVLRDPAKRAEYDSSRGLPKLWAEEEIRMPPDRPRPPAMRSLGIASAVLALGLVVAVWALPPPRPPNSPHSPAPAQRQAAIEKLKPPIELEPEPTRLARLRGDFDPVPPAPLVSPLDQAEAAEASLEPPIAPPPRRIEPVQIATASTRRAMAPSPRPIPAATVSAANEASNGCRPGGSVGVSAGCKNQRLLALDQMAAGFFSQSMAHADTAKKALLLSSHTRSAAARAGCRSDSCIGEAYLRQMREISAIMEGRSAPDQ